MDSSYKGRKIKKLKNSTKMKYFFRKIFFLKKNPDYLINSHLINQKPGEKISRKKH